MPARLQAKALLLLAIFLAAGTSLPSPDALAYHGDSGEPGRSQAHIEPAGGCLSHSDNCLLSRTAPGSGAGVAAARELRLDSTSRITPQPRQILPPASADLLQFPQPRAPPVRVV